MNFKHIIGLDIGTNSLGWSLVKEFEDETIEIVKTGVHIFPIGTIVDDKSNKEKTKNEQRRGYRAASRMRYRFKLRRKNLKEVLTDLGMIPDYSKLYKPKNKTAQSYELYKLRADAINSNIIIPLQEIGRIFMLLNKYRGFKSNAKKLHQKDSEAGEVKKGYERLQQLIEKSGAETIGEYFFKMHETARTWYNEDKWHNPNEPIDERAFNDAGEFILFNSNGIRRHRGRYTLRDMYTNEFDKIWAAQKIHYSDIFTGSKEEYVKIIELPYKQRIEALKDFKKTNYWHIRDYCIYYQRPLKSQKKYVSNCQFEHGEFEIKKYISVENSVEREKQKRIWKKKAKKACPKSHPYFQEFRIWQKLHQIKYLSTAEDASKRKALKPEWMLVLADSLMQNFEVFLNKIPKLIKEDKLWFSKILHQNGLIQDLDGYTFHIDKADEDIAHEDKIENRIMGNATYATFISALGKETFIRLNNEVTTRKEQISQEEVVEVSESKIFQLWHHLYIAKDGLFKEDDWLMCILTEKTKWNFTPEQAQRLIEMGLQPDYASYSSKVLKAILPAMRKGVNEYEALKSINRGYINEDNTIGKQPKLKEKIAQLNYQELRNPVVERALSKTIKLVNTILEKYKNDIDRETFEIRIESTRQFRKPRQERENERRKNTEKDKLREQYAIYLTKNKEKLGFKGDIYKYSSIVAKYELWLQMNMNEGDETFISEFKNFTKVTKQEDKLKHKLWLECGRMCPYTGNIINLTDCFSAEVEIEHIIPLSRSLDDSINNKTLTYRHTNAAKGNMTPLEYLGKIGGEALNKFKARLRSKTNDFADNKKDLFLAENIKNDFSSNQIANTSYIAKYTRQKMWEVCKKGNVQFTNGSATSELRNKDWSLSNLLDKIRYEEDHKINIDEYYKQYYSLKKDFIEWYKKKYNTTDFTIKWSALPENEDVKIYIAETNNNILFWDEGIKVFNDFRNTSGKKDRSDHRHHAIDAFVTACCSPKIIKALSTYNAAKENQHLEFRDKVDRQFSYDKLKESIATILVSHSEKQTLIKKRKNKIKTKNGVKEYITFAPQGSLHKDTFYGKLQEPVKQGYDKKDVYVGRNTLMSKNGSAESYLFDNIEGLDKIYEKNIKKVLIDRFELTKDKTDHKGNKIKPFSEKSMKEFPIFSYTPNDDKTKSVKGKPLPLVKSIRIKYKNERSLISLPDNKYADNDGNYLMVFYEKKQFDKKGNKKKTVRDFKLVSFWDANKSKRENNKLFNDEINEIALNPDCNWLKKGDIIFLGDKDEDFEKINWHDNNYITSKLFRVNELGFNPTGDGYAVIKLEPHKLLKTSKDKYASVGKFLKLSESLNALKIRLNILGEIEATGEECF
jgi:CRISPR-associated endonuclease Csn1